MSASLLWQAAGEVATHTAFHPWAPLPTFNPETTIDDHRKWRDALASVEAFAETLHEQRDGTKAVLAVDISPKQLGARRMPREALFSLLERHWPDLHAGLKLTPWARAGRRGNLVVWCVQGTWGSVEIGPWRLLE